MIGKAVLHLHDLMSEPRLDLAATQVTSGLGVVYDGTWFVCEFGHLWCNSIHSSRGESVTEADAYALIEGAQVALRQLRSAQRDIDQLAERSVISYAVVEDYGQGVAPVCCLVVGQLVWGEAAWKSWRRSEDT